jgi:hypothetical protein
MTGKVVAFIFVGVALMGALWLGFKPQHGGFETAFPAFAAVPAAETPSTNGGQRVPERSVRQEVFEINIQDGRVVAGSTLLQAHEGDEITLKIVSDRSDELHLHGYDMHARIVPGETTTLVFAATRTGRFGLEMHRTHIELGTLEVYPR